MPLEIKAILAKADVPNANGRVYPKAVLERAVAEAHQNDPRPLTLTAERPGERPTLADIAGQALRLSVEDGNLVATVKLFDNPLGKMMQKLIGSGFTGLLPMTTQGIGTVEDGVVQMDFTLTGLHMDIEQLSKDSRLREVLIKKMRSAYERQNSTPVSQDQSR